MTRLEWGVQRTYKAGVSLGVAYFADEAVAWSGLIQVEEKPAQTISSETYLDGVKVLQTHSREEFYAVVAAYIYPVQLEDEVFGFSYRVMDELHIVYNATARVSDRPFKTIGSKVEPSIFGFEISTVPSRLEGIAPTAHLIVDLANAGPDVVTKLNETLYGTDISDPTLPPLEELVTIFDDFALYKIVDHGDGTWTAIGPDEAIEMVSATEFVLHWPDAAVTYLDPETYTIRSW